MLGWIALVITAWAEDPTGDARPLTYRDALQSALSSNPTLRRAHLDVEQAEGALLGARGAFDPQLGADGMWRQSRSRGFFQGFPFSSESRSWNLGADLSGSTATGTTYALNAGLDRNFSSFITNFGLVGANEQIQDAYTSSLSVSVRQQLLRGLRLSFNLQNVTQARQGVKVADLALERARQEALSQTAQAYWAWAYQDRLRDIADRSVEVADEALRIGLLRVEAGELAPVEQTRLEAALVQARANAMDAEVATSQAADTLLLMMGRRPGERILPATEAGEVELTELDVEAAAQVARAQNLDLAVARANLETAEIDQVNARHGRLPTLTAIAATGVGAQDTNAGSALTGLLDEDAFPFIQVGGEFRVPIGNRAARGAAAVSATAVEQRRLTVQDLEANITAQVHQQVRVLEAARRRVELADANVRLADQTLSAEEALAEAGRTIHRNVLDARTQADAARVEAARARTEHRLAQVELLRLQGQLDEDL